MRKKTNLLVETLSWILILTGPLLLALFLSSRVFAVTTVNQRSMLDTLEEGDVLFCSRTDYAAHPPARGEIVLFYADNREKGGLFWEFGMRLTDMADNWRSVEVRRNVRYLKRVIGLPGETVEIRDGMVYIEGEVLQEPYVKGMTEARDLAFPLVVPADSFLLLGDNREESKDSRDFGCIRLMALEGKPVLRLLPLKKWGPVP